MKIIPTMLASVVLSFLGEAPALAQEQSGVQLFMTHCASCHGAEGEGGGPVAAVMAITVPNLRTLAMRNGGAFPADAVASYIDGRDQRAAHGSRTMPIWGDFLRTDDAPDAELAVRTRIAALVAFIERQQYR
jgi:mono/diheme cytochrome c family protein